MKPPSPTHHRARTTSGKTHVRGQSDGEIKTPVRERVKDILNAATSPSGSSAFSLAQHASWTNCICMETDAALWGLWRWVKPPIIDTEDTKSNSSFCIGRLSECSDDDDEIPADPFDTDIDPASDEPGTQSPPVGDTLLPDINQRISGQKPSDQNTPHHIPPDEDMWLLFECKIGAGNAYLLSEALAMTPLNKPLLKVRPKSIICQYFAQSTIRNSTKSVWSRRRLFLRRSRGRQLAQTEAVWRRIRSRMRIP